MSAKRVWMLSRVLPTWFPNYHTYFKNVPFKGTFFVAYVCDAFPRYLCGIIIPKEKTALLFLINTIY